MEVGERQRLSMDEKIEAGRWMLRMYYGLKSKEREEDGGIASLSLVMSGYPYRDGRSPR
jgi:hypothetical protein